MVEVAVPRRAVIVGVGAVGGRVARQLQSAGGVDDLTIVEADAKRAAAAAAALGPPARAEPDFDAALAGAKVVVLACPRPHRQLAEAALQQGANVVSCSDDLDDVRALLELDADARRLGCHVVAGTAFSPGMSCLLAAHAARGFDDVDEIHIAKVGTGGPECARQRHRSLRHPALDWRDGAWVRRPAGSGRELCWFPEPVRAIDCYRAASPETLLLVGAFPAVNRVTVRTGANRRDRFTARLPMLRRPHPEGGLGAIRVEVRGSRGTRADARTLGAVDRPAVAAGIVAATAALWVLEDRMTRVGAGGLAALVDALPFLLALAERGVRAATFEGPDTARAGVEHGAVAGG